MFNKYFFKNDLSQLKSLAISYYTAYVGKNKPLIIVWVHKWQYMYKNSETYHMNRLYPMQSVILPIKINFPLSD